MTTGDHLQLDFGRRDRSADHLRKQLDRWQLFRESERAILVFLFREGDQIIQSGLTCSRLECSQRSLSRTLTLSKTAVHKAIASLTSSGVMTSMSGSRSTTIHVCWQRVSALIDAAPDPTASPHFDTKWSPPVTAPHVHESKNKSLHDPMSHVHSHGASGDQSEQPAATDPQAWRRYAYLWTELQDGDVRVGGIELARALWREALRQQWLDHANRVEFLAAYFHCANMPAMEGDRNNAAKVLKSRVKRRRYIGIHDKAWQLAKQIVKGHDAVQSPCSSVSSVVQNTASAMKGVD